MTTGLATILSFFRGQTIRWKTTFFDFDNNIVQPTSANLLIFYDSLVADDILQTIAMTPPSGGQVTWTAFLDTRNFAAPQKIQWSIETPGVAPISVAVQDGFFLLTANQANRPTF